MFLYPDGVNAVRLAAHPGDFVLVPPFVPHREKYPDPTEPTVVVIAGTTQQPIKVSVPELHPRRRMCTARRLLRTRPSSYLRTPYGERVLDRSDGELGGDRDR